MRFLHRSERVGVPSNWVTPPPDSTTIAAELSRQVAGTIPTYHNVLFGEGWSAALEDPKWESQRENSRLVAAVERVSLLNSALGRDICHLQSPASLGAMWLTVLPGRDQNSRLAAADFRALVCWWLGTPISPDIQPLQRCALCGSTAVDAMGDHAVSCPRGGALERHRGIQQVLLDMLRKYKVQCAAERGWGVARENVQQIFGWRRFQPPNKNTLTCPWSIHGIQQLVGKPLQEE